MYIPDDYAENRLEYCILLLPNIHLVCFLRMEVMA